MTNKELNAAVKKFAKDIKSKKIDPHSHEAKTEFTRLYGADKTLMAHNAESIRILLVLNRRYLYEPLHTFGAYIEI